MFTYCMNNPVNMADTNGNIAWWIIGGGIGAVVGGAVGAVISYKTTGKVNWKSVTGGAVAGADAGWAAQAAYTSIIGVSGIGFTTFQKLKDYLGSTGVGKQWHHIVEQCQEVKSGFANTMINNTKNAIAINSSIHAKINGYYSSIQPFTNGQRVRDWLAGQS
jgi:phage tail tape-measure protein